jgi:peptidoglycan/LPS O-acetylase OafA/YrhL
LSISYRSDIDGLRAVAVLAVVIYHAGIDSFSLFTGGFLGVDVFFVISGFLITQILLKELAERRFSLASFYERRIRRILPLLFTVKLVSIPFAWLLMMPRSVYEYSASIVSSFVFSSNIWFSLDEGYWAADNSLKPFLHTWSLSVEEQYYLVFPLLLWWAWRYGKTFLLSFFSITFIVSLCWAQIWSVDSPTLSFYLLPTRFWEMLAGSMAAIYVVMFRSESHKLSNSLISTAGLVLVISAMFWFDKETLHPSLYTLVPIIGTTLILTFPSPNALAYKVLSSKLMVQIGLLSYGAYLWHYPLFAFSQISEVFVDTSGRLLMIAVTFILSYLTYHLVEQPFRKRSEMTFRHVMGALTLATAGLLAFNMYSLLNAGNVGRYNESQLKFLGMTQGENESHAKYVTERYNNEAVGRAFSSNDMPKVLIIGDSYSQDFYNILKESEMGSQVEIVTRYIPVYCRNVAHRFVGEVTISAKRKRSCTKTIRVGHPAMKDVIAASDMVFVASNWDSATIGRVSDLQAELYAEGATNVMFVGAKRFPGFTAGEVLGLNKVSIVKLEKGVDPDFYRDIVNMRQQNLDNYIDLQTLICGLGDLCRIATHEGFPISYDGYHLSRWGAKESAYLLGLNQGFMQFWQKSLTDN